MKRPISMAFAAVMMMNLPANAGEAVQLATKAEAQLAKGEHAAAIETMRQAMLATWNQSKIAIRQAFFVKKRATGFGVHDARESNVFKPGEALLVYVEPVGQRWSKEDGVLRSNISADLKVKSADGKVLGGQDAIARFALSSREQNMEYFVQLTYSFDGIKPGKYIAGTTLNDKIGGSSISFDLPFEVK